MTDIVAVEYGDLILNSKDETRIVKTGEDDIEVIQVTELFYEVIKAAIDKAYELGKDVGFHQGFENADESKKKPLGR